MSFNYRFEPPFGDELDYETPCTYDKYCEGEFDCEICKYNKGDDIMNQYVKQSILLNASIENEFGPLDWFDITVHEEDGTGSISFVGPSRKECINENGEYDRICFIAKQDGFFSKMNKIKNMIKNCGMTADLIKFEADCECPYSEATININFEGGEL